MEPLDMVAEAMDLLSRAADILAELIDDCDHSVGICFCKERNMIDELRASFVPRTYPFRAIDCPHTEHTLRCNGCGLDIRNARLAAAAPCGECGYGDGQHEETCPKRPLRTYLLYYEQGGGEIYQRFDSVQQMQDYANANGMSWFECWTREAPGDQR